MSISQYNIKGLGKYLDKETKTLLNRVSYERRVVQNIFNRHELSGISDFHTEFYGLDYTLKDPITRQQIRVKIGEYADIREKFGQKITNEEIAYIVNREVRAKLNAASKVAERLKTPKTPNSKIKVLSPKNIKKYLDDLMRITIGGSDYDSEALREEMSLKLGKDIPSLTRENYADYYIKSGGRQLADTINYTTDELIDNDIFEIFGDIGIM